MTKKNRSVPADLSYIDEEQDLCRATQDVEFEELYADGFSPDNFAREEDKAPYIDFCKKRGYDLP